MAFNRINAVHAINTYLYNRGKTVGIFKDSSVYGGRTPFTTSDQVGKFQSMRDAQGAPVPYVVYNWSKPRTSANFFVKEETIIYLVYGRTVDEITNIVNFITDNLEQNERSAINVQAFLENPANSSLWGSRNASPFTVFEFHTIDVAGASGPTPITEAGGVMEAQITINVKYGLLSTAILPDETFVN